MTAYVIVQLKMTDRAAYDRYQARFFDVFRKFDGRLLSADEEPSVIEGQWDRDKLVLMSFPTRPRFAPGRTRRSIARSQRIEKQVRKQSCCSRADSRLDAAKGSHHHSQP
jgi:uncharacterized protein (DUF1330 family)